MAAEDHREDPESGVPSLILDCDASQFAAIKAALEGRNITIQGPPGTGKSQTIANLIASLLHQGKRVLFVAEKMAALEVVYSRLADAGIGDFLLELHSAKASKKSVLQSLRIRLAKRNAISGELNDSIARRRKTLRDRLNAYSSAINSPFGKSGLTVHDIIWRFYDFRNKPIPKELAGFRLNEVAEWDPDAIDARVDCLESFCELKNGFLTRIPAMTIPGRGWKPRVFKLNSAAGSTIRRWNCWENWKPLRKVLGQRI